MKSMIGTKQNKWQYLVIEILVSVFLISKMLRGLSDSGQVGGVWNIIQLLIIVLGVLCFLLHFNSLITQRCCAVIVIYSVLAFLVSLIYVPVLSISSVYSFVMILYPGAALCLFYYLYLVFDCSDIWIYKITFYLIAYLFIYNQVSYFVNDTEGSMISSAYYVLALLPIIVLYTDKLKLLPIFAAFVAIVVSGKRAGLIAIVVAVLGYYFIKYYLRKGSTLKLFRIIVSTVFIGALLFLMLYVLDKYFSIGVINRMLRIFDDGGSGRDVRWKMIIQSFISSDLPKIFFGHGHDSLVASLGNAHNDFLQLLYENGIIVTITYCLYYISLISVLIKMIRRKYRFAPEFFMSLIISFCFAMFSFYVIEGTFITCGMICQGFILADFTKKYRHLHKSEEYYDDLL